MSFFKTLAFINNHQLAKRHRLRAITRFFKWQISQKINPRPVAYPFIGNTKLWVQKGMTGATGNIYTGLHDFEDMCFLLHFLRADDLFIDIGANIGSYTILAAGVAQASCISIEPVPQTFEVLKKNVSINDLFNKVTALNIGIGAEKGILSFTKNLDTVNHVIRDNHQEKNDELIEVSCECLDSLLAGKQQPSLLKIDVEGFEQEVINGAKGLLTGSTLKAIIIELNGSGGRYGYDENNIHQQLKAVGFNCYQYAPFTRELINVEGFGNLNTIYLKDIDFVKDRLKTANSITVFSEKI
jgi:FkbM family methyltransferase